MWLKIILTGLIVTGSHTMGHLQQANDYGLDSRVDISQLREIITVSDPVKKRVIDGAGFVMQDRLSRHFNNTDMASTYHMSNALYKIGYYLKVPKQMGLKGKDDLDNMGRIATFSVLISAMNDLYRFNNPDASNNISFWQSKYGVPGLITTISF